MLDSLELEPTYNPLQAWSHLYSHLSNTLTKLQGRIQPSLESRALRKVQLPPYSLLYAQNPRETSSPVPGSPHPREQPPPLVEGKTRPTREGEKEQPFALDQGNYNPCPVGRVFCLGTYIW